jgi:hypothetical protein
MALLMRRIGMLIRQVAMPYLKIAAVALLCACSGVHASSCVADSAATRPHLVELYSSEGCSSCPPAESWLRTLHTGAEVVPLEFHVDYWNDLGWKDRFSAARYTARQNDQARRDGGTSIFTPQLVLDGRNWSSWYRGGPLAPPDQAGLSMHLAAEVAGKSVRVDATSHPTSAQQFDGFRTYVALVEDGLATQVRAGENRGVLLKHDHVVRAFAGPLPQAHATLDIAIPPDANVDNASIVAFVQDEHDGKVAQVVTLALAECRK